MGRLGLIGLLLAVLLCAASERASAGCCYESTTEWYLAGYVELPGNYGKCDVLIVTGECDFDTYSYYCVDDCGQLCITECYDYGEWLPVAKAKDEECTLDTTMEHMEVCIIAWWLNVSEQGDEVWAKCLCADN